MAKKSQKELEFQIRARRIDRIADVAGTAIRYGSVVACVASVAWALRSFAGQSTVADVGIKFIGNLSISEAMAYALAGGSVLYGVRQQKLKRDTIEKMGKRNQQLESKIDPNRSSSKLTPRGTTPKGEPT